VLPDNGDGTFGAAQTIPAFVIGPLKGLVVGDFTGNGKLNLGYADLESYNNDAGQQYCRLRGREEHEGDSKPRAVPD
jgi:hypothetical protein